MSEEKVKVFFLQSNHRSPRGILQQKDIINRVFKSLLGYELIETNIIIPNQINLIIEELNIDLINLMKKIKRNYEQTRYILFLTEYLTKSNFGYQLNTFDLKTKLSHFYLSQSLNIPFINFLKIKNNYESFSTSLSNKFFYKIRNLLENIIAVPLRLILDRDGITNAFDITRRENCLKKSKSLFDLCIGNCNSVNHSYKNFFKCEVILIPTFIDKKKTKTARSKTFKSKRRNYVPGLFLSGRLTNYRKKVLAKLSTINSFYPSAILFGYRDSIKYFKKNKEIVDIPLFEIYIKQEKNWPYSSPMRTLMSIEEGFIPIDLGNFNDHSLNNCTRSIPTNITTEELCSFLSKINIEKEFKKLDILIEKHNKNEINLMEGFELALNKLKNT